MLQRATQSTRMAVRDEKLAQESLLAIVKHHRVSLGWLIQASHNLKLSYYRTYFLKKENAQFNSKTKTYTVFVPQTPNSKSTCVVFHKVIPNLTVEKMFPLFKWFGVVNKMDIVDVCRLIHAAADLTGVALDRDTHIAAGFYEDAPMLKQTYAGKAV